MIKIDYNVPMPSRPVSSDFPFERMGIGDSFVVTHLTSKQVYNLVHRASIKGKRFISRREGTAIRIWRAE